MAPRLTTEEKRVREDAQSLRQSTTIQTHQNIMLQQLFEQQPLRIQQDRERERLRLEHWFGLARDEQRFDHQEQGLTQQFLQSQRALQDQAHDPFQDAPSTSANIRNLK